MQLEETEDEADDYDEHEVPPVLPAAAVAAILASSSQHFAFLLVEIARIRHLTMRRQLTCPRSMALPKMGLANDAPKSTEKVEPDTVRCTCTSCQFEPDTHAHAQWKMSTWSDLSGTSTSKDQ